MEKVWMVILFFIAFNINCIAQTYTYNGSGDWHDSDNWLENGVNCNCVPNSSSEVIIPNQSNVEILNPAESNILTIDNGGTLVVNETLTVSRLIVKGNLENHNSIAQNGAGGFGLSVHPTGIIHNHSVINVTNCISTGIDLTGEFHNHPNSTLQVSNILQFSVAEPATGIYPRFQSLLKNYANASIQVSDITDQSSRGIFMLNESTIENSGNIAISNINGTYGLRVSSGCSFTNNGQLNISSIISGDGIQNSGNFTNNQNGVIEVGDVDKIGIIINVGSPLLFNNYGTINIGTTSVGDIGLTGTYTNYPSGIINISNTENAGLSTNLFSVNNGTISISNTNGSGIDGQYFTNNGIVNISSTDEFGIFLTSTLENEGTINILSNISKSGISTGRLTNTETGKININSSNWEAISIGPLGFNSTNTGSINVNESSSTGITIWGTAELQNNGFISIQNTSENPINISGDASLVNQENGITEIVNSVGDAFSNSGTFTNSGTLRFLPGIGGHIIGDDLTNNGTIEGSGSINSTGFTNNGTLSPGLSPGTFTFSSTLNLTSATLDMEIEGTAGGGQPGGHDNIVALGMATVGGTLNVTIGGGYVPQNNDLFTLLEFASGYSGIFAVENLPNGHWSIEYQANAIVLKYSDVCFLNGVTFNLQSEITNYTILNPGCTTIGGEVFIDGANINSLSGLSSVSTMLDNLNIYDTELTSLSGLDNLATIGNHFRIYNNDQLTSLDGLEKLVTLGGDLDLRDNGNITDIQALTGLTSIGRSLLIFNHPSLTDLNGLDNLTSIANRIYLANNSSMTSLSGLENLTSIGGGIRITGHSSLQSLTSFNNLMSINGELFLSENDNLSSLSGLDNIDHAGISDLTLEQSSILSECDILSICNFLENGGTHTISLNATGCNNYNEVGTACGFFALPVELIDFQAFHSKNQISLTWSTALETDNQGFEIQRSTDGLSFTRAGWMDGHGTTSDPHIYHFTDPFIPQPGHYFYRLQQNNWDGSTSISPVISIKVESGADSPSSLIFPNPNDGQSTWLSISSSDGSSVSVRVFDARGRHLNSLSLSPFEKGAQVLPVKLPELRSGVYLFEISREGKVEWVRVMMEQN